MTLDYFYGQSGELFAYFRIPKALFQDSRFRQLSTDARTLYGILLDRMSLSAKNSWVDEHGRVYIIYTVREVQESLCCAEHKAVKLFRELEQADLIERKRRGLGRPSLIYVKNFSSGLPKAQIQNCANSNSCAAESAVQVRPKSQSNKTDKNKTEKNHPFLPDETDRLTQREQLEDYFYQVLEVELLLRLCPDDEDVIYQIVDLLVDTCSTKRKMLRIAGDDKPTEVVRSRLKKLTADHIRFVLGCLTENTSPVRNMKQYLLAALFNAPTTMNLYIAIQSTDEGWDYTIYHSDFSVMDGGQVDAPELTIQEVREQILETHHMEKGRRLLQDYDFVMDRAAEAEELGANHRPSTLEKLTSLAGAKEKCDAPECNPAGCRKVRDVHEL